MRNCEYSRNHTRYHGRISSSVSSAYNTFGILITSQFFFKSKRRRCPSHLVVDKTQCELSCLRMFNPSGLLRFPPYTNAQFPFYPWPFYRRQADDASCSQGSGVQSRGQRRSSQVTLPCRRTHEFPTATQAVRRRRGASWYVERGSGPGQRANWSLTSGCAVFSSIFFLRRGEVGGEIQWEAARESDWAPTFCRRCWLPDRCRRMTELPLHQIIRICLTCVKVKIKLITMFTGRSLTRSHWSLLVCY